MDYHVTPVQKLEHFRIHILVFLLAFLAALTVAHPVFFLNDEWITGNQLAQLNEGHQAIVNEGKYGVYENGTLTQYFTTRNNILVYSLFLPILSLPAEGLVNLFGDHFIFFITYLWTFLLIGLALVLNAYFPDYTYLRKWRWTTGLIVLAFAGFFLNLLYYEPLPRIETGAAPEILAIVLTHVLLFAFLAVTVYEILRVIFQNSRYAVFGTCVCLSCSSYLFWTTFCKDHLLVAFLLALILLMVITFYSTDDLRALAGSFFFVGLLAWARPDLGLFIFIALCILVVFFMILAKGRACTSRHRTGLFLTPLFTIPGAIPFFINNYLATKNILIPAVILSMKASSLPDVLTSPGTHPYMVDTFSSLLQVSGNLQIAYISSPPADLYGVIFAPYSGSMGILPLVPVFLVAVLVLPLLLKKNVHLFDHKEKVIIGILLLVSFAVSCTYFNRIYGMNVSPGVIPDMRYLSPIYLPLTIIGLMVIRKMTDIAAKPLQLLAGMAVTWIMLIPLSLALILLYRQVFPDLDNVFLLLNHWTTIAIFILSLMFIILCYYSELGTRRVVPKNTGKLIFIVICAAPLIWQIDASFHSVLFLHSCWGYFYWIPLVLKLFSLVL